LNELGFLSIENDVVRRIDFTNVVPSFANEKNRKGIFFYLVVLALAYSDVFWCLHMYSGYALCLLLQMLFVAA
jgi:hypothetical protein